MMAPSAMANGSSHVMSLTEYTADSLQEDLGKTAASQVVPRLLLQPDGHPDVCQDSPGPIEDRLTHSA